MSLNIAPVYGKQYIRYAETWEAATDKPNPEDPSAAPLVGTVELLEFAVVTYATYAGPNKVCAPGDVVGDFNLEQFPIVGVNQSYIPTALSQPYTARQASIATSGSLIVEVHPESSGEFELNAPLTIHPDGRAFVGEGKFATVSLNGTTPLIREFVEIGGRRIVIVSFA